ncbi:MAG TPA: sodium:proton antiporter [Kofleriaceae bacterium]|jgi:CPA1 family monovalent cation:H+ antiporter
MTSYQLVALFVCLTALLAWLNARWLRLPSQVGMLVISLVGSAAVLVLDAAGVVDASHVRHVVGQVDFAHTLLDGLLGLMLFAGAMHLDLGELARQRWQVAALSLGATVASTVLVGVAVFGLFGALGLPLGWLDALLFGALISPTDPIAVMGLLKRSRVPRDAAAQIAGESLFNDGVGVVLYTVLLAVRAGAHTSALDALGLFARAAIGGAAFGLAVGMLGRLVLRSVEDHVVSILVTLALVLGGYALADQLGISGPIGAVVAGLVIGDRAREPLLAFWELVDEILNAILFVLLGLEATRLHVSLALAVVAVAAVPVVIGARLASISAAMALVRPFGARAVPHARILLTWAGLRGGLAVALALSLPDAAPRDELLVVTFVVVACSVIGQGLTMPWLLRRLGID